jgi:hypothetical protein
VSDDVAVRLPDGTAGTVPASQVSQLPEGSKPMSAAEVAAEKKAIALDKKYEFRDGNIGQAAAGLAAATVAGGARGASLGLSDYLASEFGGREYLNEVKEAFPVASTVGEAGGMLGLAAATGGAGAAAEGATAARLGGGLLARVGAAGARGFAEGAIQGVGSAISESSLKNTDLTGQALIAAGLTGGGVGLGLGAGLSALGAGIGKLRAPKAVAPTAQAYETLAAGAYRTPAPGVGQALREEVEAGAAGKATKGAARTSIEETAPSVEVNIGPAKQRTVFDQGADAIAANPLVRAEEKAGLKSVWERRDAVLRNEEETIQKATRGFAKSLDDELAASRRVDMQSFGDAKSSQMEKLLDKAKFAEQMDESIGFVTRANEVVSTWRNDVTSGLGPSAIKEWDGYIRKMAASESSGALHTTMDNMKRWLGRQAQFGKGPYGLSVAAREMDALYQGEGGLMRLLESDVWGSSAAKAQREINAATSAYMAEGDILRRKFTTQYGSEAGRPLYRADPAALSSHFNKLTDVAADLESEGVRNYISARERMLDAMGKNYSFDASTTKALGEAKKSLANMRGTYEASVNDAALTNQVKKALESERARSIGGLAGAVLDTATKPYTTMQRLASLEQQTQNVVVKITGGTRKLVAEAEPAAAAVGKPTLSAPRRTGPGFFSQLLDSAKPASDVAKTGATMVAGRAASDYERRAEQLNRLKSDPAGIADRVGGALGPNSTAAPKATAVATATAIRGIEFLAEKMPPGRTDPYSAQPMLERPRISDAEASKFRRFLAAADDPTIVLDEAAKGTLTREHVEAVKAIYPALYEEMQVQVMESLATSRKKLSYSRRIQLGILLDIPTDKTLSPDFVSAIQGTYAQGAGDAESPPPPPARPINVAGSLQTATQSAVESAE